jgi:hypothetical protein
MLENELDKIHDFQKDKTEELARRIDSAEKSVYALVEEEDAYHNQLASQYGTVHNGNRASPPPSTNGNGRAHRQYPSYTEREAEEQRRTVTHAQDGGSDDDLDSEDDERDDTSRRSSETFEEQFNRLEEQVAVLVADVHDLALYSKLNLTGFMKILKVSSFVLLLVFHCSHSHRNMM